MVKLTAREGYRRARMSSTKSSGRCATPMPAALKASIFSIAVPADPEMRFGSIDDIVARGLHEYLSEFLERIYDLGDLINKTYFWSTDE